MKPTARLRSLLPAIGCAILTTTLHADDVTWDITPGTVGAGDSAVTGGAGTWDITNGNWTTDGGANNIAWSNDNNDTAVFGGTAGAVTLVSDVTVGGLTFNTNGYSIAPGTGPYGITFGAPGEINVSTGTTTITAVISGSSKITKTGAGTIFLNAGHTFNGGIDLNAGRIQISNGANEGSMLGAAGNTLVFTGNSELYNADGEATLGQSVTINSGVMGTIGGAFGERTIINGVFAGSGTLHVRGYSAGFDLELRNTANTFTGAIFMETTDQGILGVRSLADSSNTISLQSNGNNGSKFEFMSGAVSPLVLNQRQFVLHTNGDSGTNLGRQATILNNAATANTVTINTDLAITGTGNKKFMLGGSNTGNNTFGGAIIDAIGASKLTLYKQDAGKWILSGVNTYEGDTIVDNGILEVGGAGQLGSGNYAGNISVNSGDQFIYNSTAAQTLGGVISGAGALVKDNSGVLTLTNDNTYTGATTVDGGTLIINGSSSSTSLVTVASGATLGGSGTVGAATTINGIHSPGNSPGIQTFAGDLTYDTGASVIWELVVNSLGLRGTDFDGINVGGTLDFAGATTLDLSFNFTGSTVDWQNAFWDSSHTGTDGWLIYDGATSLDGFSNFSVTSSNWLDGSGQSFNDHLAGNQFGLFQDGNNIYLNYTVIPEPRAALLGSIGLLMLLRRRRA